MTATFGSALASKVAVTGTAGTRAALGIGLDVALCGSRDIVLAAGLDFEADLVV